MSRRIEPVRRVERVSDAGMLEEGRCPDCGAEQRGGACTARCLPSREHAQDARQDRVARTDEE